MKHRVHMIERAPLDGAGDVVCLDVVVEAERREVAPLLGAIESEEYARLAKVLVICNGCFDQMGNDHPDQPGR